MSATKENCPNATESKAIPIRRVLIDDDRELPHDYSTTPGGTMFSTTPGGTRIIYQRPFLMKCRKSPLARTPPHNLPDIPGVTMPGDVQITERDEHAETGMTKQENGHEKLQTVPENEKGVPNDEQFAMDM